MGYWRAEGISRGLAAHLSLPAAGASRLWEGKMRLKHPQQPLAHRSCFCKTFLSQNTFLNITSTLKISCTFQIQLQQVLGGFQDLCALEEADLPLGAAEGGSGGRTLLWAGNARIKLEFPS